LQGRRTMESPSASSSGLPLPLRKPLLDSAGEEGEKNNEQKLVGHATWTGSAGNISPVINEEEVEDDSLDRKSGEPHLREKNHRSRMPSGVQLDLLTERDRSWLSELKPPYGDDWDSVSMKDRCNIAAVLIEDGIHGRELHHLFNLDSLKVYRFTHGVWWRRIIVVVAIINLSLAFFETPCLDELCAPKAMLLTFETLCIMCYTADTALEIFARGRKHFFASGWNCMKIPVLLFSFIWMWVPHTLRLQRMLRPFFALAYAHNLRKIMNSMLQGFQSIAAVGTLVVFHLLIFSVIGSRVFREHSPEEFGNFYRAWISLFTLLTTANYPDVMLPAYHHTIASFLFFAAFLILGLFILLNLVLAIVFNSYKERLEFDQNVYKQRAKSAMQAAFALCETSPGRISQEGFETLMAYLRPDLDQEHVKALFRVADLNSEGSIQRDDFGVMVIIFNAYFKKVKKNIEKLTVEERKEFDNVGLFKRRYFPMIREKLRQILETTIPFTEHKACEKLVDVTVVINLALLIADDYISDSRTHNSIYIWINLILVFHALEMAAEIMVHLPNKYFKDAFNVVDCLVLFVALLEWIIEGQGGDLLALRTIRILRLLKMNEGFGLLYVAVGRSYHILFALFCVLLTYIYFFAVVGMDLLDGKLDRGNVPENLLYHQNDYYGLNYNSLVNGMIVQFNLLIVNNWFIVADAAVAVTNEGMRYFFIFFYIVGVLVALNVITAFIIDTVIFVKQSPERQGKYGALTQKVERICTEYAEIKNSTVVIQVHHSIDLVLGEMFTDEDEIDETNHVEENHGINTGGAPHQGNMEDQSDRSVTVFNPDSKHSRQSSSKIASALNSTRDSTLSTQEVMTRRRNRTVLMKLAKMHRGTIA